MKKILIYGVGTFKNRGVEAIVNSTINQIPNNYDLQIASFDLEYNKEYYADRIRYIEHNRKNHLTEEEKKLEKEYLNMPFDYNKFEQLYQKDVVEAMDDADICISVGGDSYCYQPCNWLYALDKKSHDLNKKTILWGASLFEKIDDINLISNLKNFDVLVIRESLTLDAIKDYVDPNKIIFAKDPAFALKTKKISMNPWYKNRKYIVLNVSPLTIKNDEQFRTIINFIKYILRATKYSICLLPHVTTEDCNDMDILTRLKENFKKEKRVFLEEDKYDCTELKYIISKSCMVIAARTHASIAAYSSCIPTLVIGYSVKAKGIAKDLFGDYGNYVIDSKDLTIERLIEKYNFIMENSELIIESLKKQMPTIINESSHIFDKVVSKLQEQEKRKICDKEKCIGCGLCSNVCPVDAIEMKEDKEGYIHPTIDLNKCINCNQCRKKCPINKPRVENKYTSRVYALKSKNKKEVLESTSGGAFSLLAKKIISEKGVVYGVEMQENRAFHTRISKIKDLSRIRGSKYIQSSLLETFDMIKNDLEHGKKVLFSGTPCQIGAIKSLIGANEKNLITVSVVCHGVMNKKIYNKYLDELTKKGGPIKNWKFRTKEHNNWHTSSVSYEQDNKVVVEQFTDNTLMYLYLKNILERESCYDCKFKGKNNHADIIIGDYWGIEISHPEFFDNQGVSQVIINSQAGMELFEKINTPNVCDVIQCEYSDVEKYNYLCLKSIDRPLLRNISLIDFDSKTFEEISKSLKEKEFENELNHLQTESENLKEEVDRLSKELNTIYNSKRWKTMDKFLNAINRITGRMKDESDVI